MHDMVNTFIEAATRAGTVLQKLQTTPLQRYWKGSNDYATEADLAAQREILQMLSERFPTTRIIAEEQVNSEPLVPPFCTVDPLDGTAIYVDGHGAYGVALAYVDEDGPEIAVLHQPARNVFAVAERGCGCTLNGAPVRLPIHHGRLVQLAFEADEPTTGMVVRMLARLSDSTPIRLRTSVGDAIAMLEGQFDGLLNVHPGTSIWDLAPFALLIQEAGGTAVDLSGEALRWDKIPMRAIMATTDGIAKALAAEWRKRQPVP